MERVRAMIAPPSYLYEVSSARAPEGFHSVKRSRKGRIFRWISLSKIRQVFQKVYGEIRENGPFMIILHPTNNLITRILIGKKQVELLNPQVPPSKSHRILRGSSSRPLNKEYIEDRLTTRGCRLEGVVWRGAPLRLFAPFLRLNGAWWLLRRRLRSLSWVW